MWYLIGVFVLSSVWEFGFFISWCVWIICLIVSMLVWLLLVMVIGVIMKWFLGCFGMWELGLNISFEVLDVFVCVIWLVFVSFVNFDYCMDV